MKIESVVRAAAAIACGFSLAGTSPATAQTTLANPAAPPELPLRTESVADAPWLPRFQLGPRFVVGVPVGAFGDNVGTSPGATVDFRVRLGRTPVSVGAEFGYLLYGSETRRIALFPTVPEVLSDVGTTNNIIIIRTRICFSEVALLID